MKKTLLVTLDFPPQLGGIANYYKNMCGHLPARDIYVLAPPHRNDHDFDSSQNFQIFRRPILSQNPLTWPKWKGLVSEIKTIVDREKIQTIIAGQILPIGTAVYWLKKRFSDPYFVFAHGMDVSILQGRKKLLARQILKHSQGAFANSNFTKHLLEKLGMQHEKIVTAYPCPDILPNVLDGDIIRLRNTYNLHNKKILLTVGRLVERKGHDTVITAMPKILEKYPNAFYIILGDGPKRLGLDALIQKYNLKDSVVITGALDIKDVSGLYELCDVCIMPSRRLPNGDVEGFGTVFLEANLFGKPVIGTRSGGIAEAILHRETGLLIPEQSPADVANAVIELFSNQDLSHRLGTQGMDRVHHTFQWWKQTRKIELALNSQNHGNY